MPKISLYFGDNRQTLRRLIDDGVRVHSVVTDPPYGFESIEKRFGKATAKAARVEGTDGSFARLSGGFMGKSWDNTGIERDPEFWKLIYDIILPGGFVFAFSSARTGHWQAVAMEKAGFIIHPMHIWAYSSGFPKCHAADRAVARYVSEMSPEPDDWAGWVFGTQSQKPSVEPIYLAQRPVSEKNVALNLLRHGVGAVNIDDCRVPFRDGEKIPSLADPRGRYPANILHDGSEDVAAMFPGGAERFFHAFPIIYNGKAGKQDRAGSDHPTVKPVDLMRYLIRHTTPRGGTVLDPFAGSGTTAEAARLEGFNCVMMEADPDYAGFLARRFEITTDAHAMFGISPRSDL